MLLLPAATIVKFIWFIVLHIPDAIQNPCLQHGNEIASAFDALLCSGVAIIIAPGIEKDLRTKIIASN